MRQLSFVYSIGTIYLAQCLWILAPVAVLAVPHLSSLSAADTGLLVLAATAASFGQLAMNEGYRCLTVTTGASLQMLWPVFATAGGWLLFEERFGALQWLGAALILASIWRIAAAGNEGSAAPDPGPRKKFPFFIASRLHFSSTGAEAAPMGGRRSDEGDLESFSPRHGDRQHQRRFLFGDGTLDVAKALAQARRMILDGADVIDVGAESARTNRGPIGVREEIARLLPFLDGFEALCAEASPRDEFQIWPPLLSVNTWRPEVVAAVLPTGKVDLINDIGGLVEDTNARLCYEHGAALLLMHTVGEPKVPHTTQRYPECGRRWNAFFDDRLTRSAASA